jgi:hypothetical protein
VDVAFRFILTFDQVKHYSIRKKITYPFDAKFLQTLRCTYHFLTKTKRDTGCI